MIQELDRIPRQAEAERAVLGAVLLVASAYWRVVPLVGEQDFYDDKHRQVWRVVTKQAASGSTPDLITVKAELQRDGVLDRVGSAYVSSLVDGIPDIANVEHYAALVARAAKLRRLVEMGNAIMRGALDVDAEPSEIAASALESLTQTATKREHQARPLHQVLGEAYKELERRLVGEEPIGKLTTGWPELDYCRAIRRTFVVIGSPSKHGKTAFAINLAERLGAHNHPVLFVTLESTETEVGLRYASSVGCVAHSRTQDWTQLRDGELRRLTDAARISSQRPIYLARHLRTVEDIYSECRRMKTIKGLDVLMIDYIQLVRTRSGPRDREERIAAIVQRLLEMAIELDIAVIATSQVNKEHLDRQSGRLYMSDLKYAAAIGESARVGLLFQRPWVYDKTADGANPHLVKFQIEANNENLTNDFDMHFDDTTQTFAEGDCQQNNCSRVRQRAEALFA